MKIRQYLAAAYHDICVTRSMKEITIEEMDLMLSPIMDVMTEDERIYAAKQVHETEMFMAEWNEREAAAEAAKIEAN